MKLGNVKYLIISLFLGGLVGCSTDADVASYNLSMAADSFQIARRIVFIDTWTNTYLLSIEGYCSVKSAQQTTGVPGVAVTCKTGPTTFKKHYMGLSGNVTYVSEQVDGAKVSVYHYKVIFKPTVLVPDVDFEH